MTEARSGARKCEHGYCGMVRKQKELTKRWPARVMVQVEATTILVCESCRGPVVTMYRANGYEVEVTPL